MAINTLATLEQINGLATELGLNNWQIQEASWNGYIFSIISNNIINNLGTGLGPISTVIDATNNIIDATKRVIGNDPNSGQVPGGAKINAMSTIDEFSRKVALNELPNGKDNIRPLGYNGNSFTMIGIAWGANYLSAVKNNLINMFYSDEIVKQNNPTAYHVLNHPFYGQVNNSWLLNMKLIHNSTTWRACVYELRFRTEEPIILNQNGNSILQNINNYISAILTYATSLNAIWSTFSFVQNNSSYLKKFRDNIFVQDQVQDTQTNILSSVNNSMVVTKLLTNELSPIGYKNVPLNNYITNPGSLPQLKYFTGNLTPNDVNNLNRYLVDDINETILGIYAINTNDFNDTIDFLKLIIAGISSLSITLLNSYYGEVKNYIVPYNMSLPIACFLNNIDYQSNIDKIITLNQNSFFWFNNLNKGDIIILPNGV